MGDRRQRTARGLAVWAIGCAVVVTCSVGVAAALTSSTGGDGHPAAHRAVAAAVDVPTTIAAEETTTSTSPSVIPSTTVTTAVHAASTATLYCHNSRDPQCGPFHWDPDPGPNQPLTVQVTYTPERPVAGQAVTFHVVASDPDARVISHCAFFSDVKNPCLAPAAMFTNDLFGAWSPPPKKPDRREFDDAHTFAGPGTYKVDVGAWSVNGLDGDGDTAHDPYGSAGNGSVVVTVAPSSTTTTTR